jgi:hypothetical protein
LKKALTSAPILARPDPKKKYTIFTDASKKGLRAILSQEDDQGRERVIYYASRTLSAHELNYSATDLECLACVWAVKYFRHYVEGEEFDIVTDHQALRQVLSSEHLPPNPRLIRWAVMLQGYKMNVKYRRGTANKNADALSRLDI